MRLPPVLLVLVLLLVLLPGPLLPRAALPPLPAPVRVLLLLLSPAAVGVAVGRLRRGHRPPRLRRCHDPALHEPVLRLRPRLPHPVLLLLLLLGWGRRRRQPGQRARYVLHELGLADHPSRSRRSRMHDPAMGRASQRHRLHRVHHRMRLRPLHRDRPSCRLVAAWMDQQLANRATAIAGAAVVASGWRGLVALAQRRPALGPAHAAAAPLLLPPLLPVVPAAVGSPGIVAPLLGFEERRRAKAEPGAGDGSARVRGSIRGARGGLERHRRLTMVAANAGGLSPPGAALRYDIPPAWARCCSGGGSSRTGLTGSVVVQQRRGWVVGFGFGFVFSCANSPHTAETPSVGSARMADEEVKLLQDAKKWALGERVAHASWKVRSAAYDDMKAGLAKVYEETDPYLNECCERRDLGVGGTFGFCSASPGQRAAAGLSGGSACRGNRRGLQGGSKIGR
jgi:hypothetical protein